MKRFYLRVTARSPLTIRSDHAEGGVKTTQYIPGATLLGSLAASHRILRPEQEDEFTTFFLNEQVYFPHLYPAQFSTKNFHDRNLPVMPLPKTAQTCKRFSGFLPTPGEDDDDERHGVRDNLLDWAIFSLLDNPQSTIPTVLSPFDGHEACTYAEGKYSGTSCGQVMDHVSGYYRRGRFDPKQRMKAKVATRLQTRTGINREWGVVEESILYNREVFDEGMTFWGDVILPDGLADAFKKFVEEATKEDVIRMGTGRTRGLGRAQIDVWDALESKPANFTDRLHTFDAAVKQQAQAAGVQKLDPFYFAITLQSSTILCDAYLRYQKTLDVASLPEMLGLSASAYTFQRVYQSVGTQRITGWNELWGTPRPNDYAIEMGSTFLFACKQQPNNDLIQALRTREETGIGRRRPEGFGRILISDPFHLEREQA
ncbi:MAG: RAMP superfamily CRISPR-associated protein [Ktedonobacteraceae bacterium]